MERPEKRESSMVLPPLALGRRAHDDATLRARAAQAEPKSRVAGGGGDEHCTTDDETWTTRRAAGQLCSEWRF